MLVSPPFPFAALIADDIIFGTKSGFTRSWRFIACPVLHARHTNTKSVQTLLHFIIISRKVFKNVYDTSWTSAGDQQYRACLLPSVVDYRFLKSMFLWNFTQISSRAKQDRWKKFHSSYMIKARSQVQLKDSGYLWSSRISLPFNSATVKG